MGKKKDAKKTFTLDKFLEDTEAKSWAADDSEFNAKPPSVSAAHAPVPVRPTSGEDASANWRARKSGPDEHPAPSTAAAEDRAPTGADDYYHSRGRGGDYRDRDHGEYRERDDYRRSDDRDRGDYRRADDRAEHRRPEREPVQFPDAPPYTAFVGNLRFGVVEADLVELFDRLNIKDIRLFGDRGYGYVEFAEADDLRKALELNGQERGDQRPLRVNIAEKRRDHPPRGDYGRDRDRPYGRDRDFERSGDYGRDRDRDERDRSFGPRARRDEPPRDERQLPDDWRNKDAGKDLPPTFTHVHREEPRPGRRPPRADDAAPIERAPRERPKFALNPRSTDAPILAQASYTKTNPFGAAKPRDENEILRKKEEERKQREQAQAAAAPAAPPAAPSQPTKPVPEQPPKTAEAPKPKKTEEKKKPEQEKSKEPQVQQQQQQQPQKKAPENASAKPAKAQTPPASSSNQKGAKQPAQPAEPVEKQPEADTDDNDTSGWVSVTSDKKKRQGGKAK